MKMYAKTNKSTEVQGRRVSRVHKEKARGELPRYLKNQQTGKNNQAAEGSVGDSANHARSKKPQSYASTLPTHIIQREFHPTASEATQFREGLEEEESTDRDEDQVQMKVEAGPSDDIYEREADQVAEKVLRRRASSESIGNDNETTQSIADEINEENTEDSGQGLSQGIHDGPPSSVLQRKCQQCEESDGELVQAKGKTVPRAAPTKVSQLISSPGSGSPVSPAIRKGVEPVLGSKLTNVRVHTNSKAQSAARDINARAFTHRNNIFLGAGQSENDVGLMAHELTHTVQQGSAPGLQRKTPESASEDPGVSKPLSLTKGDEEIVQRIGLPDLPNISLPDADAVLEGIAGLGDTLADAGQSVYKSGEDLAEAVSNLSLDDILSALETEGERAYQQLVRQAYELGMLADLLNRASVAVRDQLLDYVLSEWLVPLLDAGDDLARYILRKYWPDNSGWVGEVKAKGDIGIDLSDQGFPVKLLLDAGEEVELSLTRVGSVITAYVQIKESAGIGLSGTIKVLEVLGRVKVKELEKWQAATNLSLIEWSTDIVRQLRLRNIRGVFAAIWSQLESFWNATQFEYTIGVTGTLEVGAEAGLDSEAVGKINTARSLGYQISIASPTPNLPGKITVQGEAELSGSASGQLAGLVPVLGRTLSLVGQIVGTAGVRIEWRIPETDDDVGEVALDKFSIYRRVRVSGAVANNFAQLEAGVEGELVLWNHGALLPDVVGMLERLASGDPLTVHDIETMIPFQEINFEVQGMGRYVDLVDMPGLAFLAGLSGHFFQGKVKLRFSMPRYRIIAMIRRQPESLAAILRLLLAGNFIGALREWADGVTENMADILSSLVSLSIEIRGGVQLNISGETSAHGDSTGISGEGTATLARVQRFVYGPDQLRVDQIEQFLRDIIHAPPGGGPQQLEPSAEQDAAAERAKTLREERDQEENPERQRELDQQIESTLGEVRPDLETMVRSQHPSLVDINPNINLYKVTIRGRNYYGTLEALLDFQGPSDTVRGLGEQLFTEDMVTDDATLSATGGLAGTSSQGRASPYPGDVDLGETIRVEASGASAAGQALANAMQQTVANATEPRGDGRQRVIFLNASVGTYPEGHPSAGRRISWLQADIARGYISWLQAGIRRRYTLAEALASPGDRAVNTFWRGPIDSRGTYGEITKVLTYEAFNRETGERLFGTPEIGQAFQTVSFGVPQVHDIDRAQLLTALGPQIRKYFHEGLYLKAVKRAYTVARMLNDIRALNDLAPLMAGPQARVRQLIDHLREFKEGVVKVGGPAVELHSTQEAKALAEDLVVRVRAIDTRLGTQMGAGLRAAGPEVRGNAVFYAVCSAVHDGLLARANANSDYGEQVEEALFIHDYLDETEE